MLASPPPIDAPMASEFSATFWGVRGTMPITDASCSQFGGNTSCVEIRCGSKRLILDAGTGLINLSKTITDANQPIDILLSHTHIDHVLGLMFIPQLYDKNYHVRVWAGHLSPDKTLMEVLSRLISPPIFPIDIRTVACCFEPKDFLAGGDFPQIFAAEGITIHTLPLNHPDRATGYRISYQDKSACYITDIEHIPDVFEPKLINFIKDADLLIYDSTYDDAEFTQYQGWGHSTWQYAIKLAEKANIRKLSLFHHDPAANDLTLSNRQKLLNNAHHNINVSRENMKLTI